MSDKMKKEIEEILRKAEDVMPESRSRPPRGQTQQSTKSSPLGRFTAGRGFKISAGKLMLGSFGLLLLALILGAATSISVVPLVVAGLVLFVVAYALFFVRPGATYEKRWRGRLIEDTPTPWERVKRWLKG